MDTIFYKEEHILNYEFQKLRLLICLAATLHLEGFFKNFLNEIKVESFIKIIGMDRKNDSEWPIWN